MYNYYLDDKNFSFVLCLIQSYILHLDYLLCENS